MAAMDFPSSPTNGQVYGNYVYNTAKGAWQANPVTSEVAVISPTAPSNPKAGDIWYNSDDGCTYVYYYDGDSYQWVASRNDATFSSTLGPRVDAVERGAVNYFINGAFDFWQRGTSFTLTGASGFQYTADRWTVRYDGFGTTLVSRQAFTPGEAPVSGYEGEYFLRASSTFDVLEIIQRIEDVRTLAGQTATISFWVKSASNQNISIEMIRNYGSGGSSQQTSILSGTIPVTTAWTRVSKVIDIASLSGKTIGAGSYLGLGVRSAANNAIDLWGMQIQAGSVATAFHRNANSLQGELAACQRYYTRLNQNEYEALFGYGTQTTTTSGNVIVNLPVQMRTVPSSVTFSNVHVGDQTSWAAVATLNTFNRSTVTALSLTLTYPSNGAQWRPLFIQGKSTSPYNSYIEVSSEL